MPTAKKKARHIGWGLRNGASTGRGKRHPALRVHPASPFPRGIDIPPSNTTADASGVLRPAQHPVSGAITRRCLLWLGLGQLCCGLPRQAEASPDSLQEQGLSRIAGDVWVTAAETSLRQRLAELPRLKESIQIAERDLDEQIEKNRRVWLEQTPSRKALEQALARLSPKDPQRKPLQASLNALRKVAVDPLLLGGRSNVRARLVTLGQERSMLSITLLWLRSTWPEMQQQYETLQADPRLQQALRQAGNGQRLGPARSYEADLKRLGEYERVVHTPWVPAYLQSGKTRLTAVVNERTPVTFTWSEASDAQTVLTTGTLASLGLQVPANAPRTTLSFEKKRIVAARQIKLDSLRLGRCLVRGAQAWVLPPEGEDLGSRLSRSTLAEHRVQLEPERLRLTIDMG